jgi:hypothetical protein
VVNRKNSVTVPQEGRDDPGFKGTGRGFPTTANDEDDAKAIRFGGAQDIESEVLTAALAVNQAFRRLQLGMEIDPDGKTDHGHGADEGSQDQQGPPNYPEQFRASGFEFWVFGFGLQILRFELERVVTGLEFFKFEFGQEKFRAGYNVSSSKPRLSV